MFSGYRYIDCLQNQTIRDLDDYGIEFENAAAIEPFRFLLDFLRESPTASCLIDEAIAYDFKFQIDENLSLDESGFNAQTVTILLPAVRMADLKRGKEVGRLLLTLAGAFRRALKANQGYQDRFDLKPDDYLRLARLVEADIDAVTTQICWELRTAGYASAWRQMLAGEKGDLAVIFTQALKSHPMGQFDGKALRAVYRQWFADAARCNEADRTALEFLDMALSCPGQFNVTAARLLEENDIRKIQKNLPFTGYLNDMHWDGKWFDGLKDTGNKMHFQHILQDIAKYQKSV